MRDSIGIDEYMVLNKLLNMEPYISEAPFATLIKNEPDERPSNAKSRTGS